MRTFEYLRPATLQEALGSLSGLANSKPMAGGMTLIPAMKMRLSTPARLVDLGGLEELRGIRVDAAAVTVGASSTHESVANSALVRAAIPALCEVAGGIGDPQVRNRGTLGGSIANNDPAADYPAALLGLDAQVLTTRRTLSAAEFFVGLFDTALGDGELITAVRFPVPAAAAYEKFKSPASRYAMVGVFAARTAGGVRVAVTGAGAGVFRAGVIEAALEEKFSVDALTSLRFPSDGLNTDIHADAQYCAHLVGVLARRAVARILYVGRR